MKWKDFTCLSLTNGKLWGLSAGTVITKETKGPNNRVLLGSLYCLVVLSLLLYVIHASVPEKEPNYGRTWKH